MRNKGRRFRKIKNKLLRKRNKLRGKPSRSPYHQALPLTNSQRKRAKYLKKLATKVTIEEEEMLGADVPVL